MGDFRLLPLGVGDAFSARHYSSCFALHAAGEWLQVDCPHPIRKLLREGTAAAGVALDVPQLLGVVLTHLHADHASGIEGLAFYYRFVLNRRLRVITPPEVAADLWDRHLAGSMEWSLQRPGEPPARRTLEEFIELIPLRAGEAVTLGPFTVRGRLNVHNIPTSAVRVAAAGRTLGYSSDTAFDPKLIEWLSDADLIVHEVSGGFMHTSYADLGALPEPLRRKMRLIHYPDDFDPSASAIQVLRPGESVLI